MGKLLRLSDFRKTPQAKRVVPSTPGAPAVYYCTYCGVDRFMLHPSGAIRCANCGALMRNIQVAESGNITSRLK